MKTCRQCSAPFEVTNEDRAFYDKVSPVFGGVKYLIPEPTLCPECRQQRQFSWRNDRKLYRRRCDHCGENMISVYQANSPFPVFCLRCWWSDNWDGTDYGLVFDSTIPFSKQYQELINRVPKLCLMNDNGTGSQNCEYNFDISRSKNLYGVVSSWQDEDCMYGMQVNRSRDCIDAYFVNASELVYNSINCEQCYSCQECIRCTQSKNCIFGFDLLSCQDCVCCANLRHKQYCIWNKQYTKEEYEKQVAAMQLHLFTNRKEIQKQFQQFLLTVPHRFAHLVNCENCTGEGLVNSKNAHFCFNQSQLHDCKWMENGDGAKDCYECSNTAGPELCYDCLTPDVSYHVLFSIFCWRSQFVLHSENCHSSKNLFGCIGLRHKQYCILNKQYTKEEYEALVPKIIEHMKKTGEWGEFFPASISPFGYNETVANEYFPLTREQALAKGFKWSDYEAPKPEATKVITAEQMKRLPDSIDQIPDDVLNWALTCEVSGKLYKIQKAELAFYRKMKLPIPRRHPDQRHADRMKLRNPRKLWHRQCAECNAEIETTYALDRPEKVLCESCYLKAVI